MRYQCWQGPLLSRKCHRRPAVLPFLQWYVRLRNLSLCMYVLPSVHLSVCLSVFTHTCTGIFFVCVRACVCMYVCGHSWAEGWDIKRVAGSDGSDANPLCRMTPGSTCRESKAHFSHRLGVLKNIQPQFSIHGSLCFRHSLQDSATLSARCGTLRSTTSSTCFRATARTSLPDIARIALSISPSSQSRKGQGKQLTARPIRRPSASR